MAEIKSTLELALERTRHLSMSVEEKSRQRQAEFEKRLNGLLQRYEDRALSADAFSERLAALQKEFDHFDPEGTVAAVCRRIDPERDNGHWLDLLSHLAPGSCDAIREILEEYHNRAERLLRESRQRILAALAEQFGITGSAVVPNLRADADGLKELDLMIRRTRSKIETAGKA